VLPACTSPLVDAGSPSCRDIVDIQPPVAWSRRNELTAGFSIQDINTHCLEQFRHHWKCLDTNNHQLWQSRPAEWKLNKCVFENLVCLLSSLVPPSCGLTNVQKLEKVIPDQPQNTKPVELRPQQIFSDRHFMKHEGKPFNPKEPETKQTA